MDLRIENLAWGTPAENIQDCLANGHHKTANLPACGRGHVYTEETTVYRRGGGRGCRKCAAIWRAEHRAEQAAKRRVWHARNRDRVNAARREKAKQKKEAKSDE